MLSQKFQRKDAETQTFGKKFESWQSGISSDRTFVYEFLLKISLRLYVFALILASISCSSKLTDPRTLIPSDALIYLETKDLGKTLDAITERSVFQQLAKGRPDLSALSGIRLSVAVTGFEVSEQKITDETSVGEISPHFVAVAETNAWNWQALSFTENKLGEFIKESYGGEAELETYPKNDGKYFVWTSQDGRKTYALVQGSIIFFGNDESAIEKCLAVKRGEAESIVKNSRIALFSADSLASGYVSTDGIAQVANLVGIQFAMRASEESEVKSFIARVLPEILRNSVKEISWTADKTKEGIEDRFIVATNPEIGQVFNETLVPAGNSEVNPANYLPKEFVSATRYNLRDPQVAWRSVLLTAQKQTDEVSGKLIAALSSSLFEPYGVDDAELFLSAVGPHVITVKFDTEGEEVAVIVVPRDYEKIKKSLVREINFSDPPDILNGDSFIWRSGDGDLAMGTTNGVAIFGDGESVLKCLQSGQNVNGLSARLSESGVVSVTIGKDVESAGQVVEVLAAKKKGYEAIPSNYLTETRFNKSGFERRTISDFGIIGSMIGLFGK